MSRQIRHNQDGSVTVTVRAKAFGTTNVYTRRYSSYKEYLEQNKKATYSSLKVLLKIFFSPFILMFYFYFYSFKYIFVVPCKFLFKLVKKLVSMLIVKLGK